MAPCSLVDGYDFNVEEVDNMTLQNTGGNHVLHSVITHKSTIAMLQQHVVEGWMYSSRMHLLEVLSQYLSGRTEKGHENFRYIMPLSVFEPRTSSLAVRPASTLH